MAVMVLMKPVFLVVVVVVVTAFLPTIDGFQQQQQQPLVLVVTSRTSAMKKAPPLSTQNLATRHSVVVSATGAFSQRCALHTSINASPDDDDVDLSGAGGDGGTTTPAAAAAASGPGAGAVATRRKGPIQSRSVRDRLRQLTGFSFTVFRATLRGLTGISLTAIYASTVAATGLWIRKITSVILSLFPSGFRYFLQPFLVAYYAPLFILRSWTGPTRKRARAKHTKVVDAWKDAVEYAERTEQDGYWPVVVTDDGYFEMLAPPVPNDQDEDDDGVSPDDIDDAPKMADALAETVEQAMQQQQQQQEEETRAD